MLIAETTRSRNLVLLAAGATLAAATAMVVCMTCDRSGQSVDDKRQDKRRVTAMRGCVEKVARQAASRSVHPPGATHAYRDVLFAARDQLQACVTTEGVGYRLALAIAPGGTVTNVEVKADANDLARVDLKVVKCLEEAASPLAFPRAPHAVRMSTYLTARE